MCETIMPPASLQSLIRSLFLDVSRVTSLSCSLDESYLLSRLEKEGVRFLTTTLPLLGKAVDKSLILEEPLKVPPNFSLYGKTRLPTFLHHLFIQVFEENGKPRINGNSMCLTFIRQVTYLFSKMKGSRVGEDQKVSDFFERISRIPTIKTSWELHEARRILHQLLDATAPRCAALVGFIKNPWGRHGPGAVADRSTPFRKWNFFRYRGVQEELFHLNPTLSLNFKDNCGERIPARVTCVPKDFRGPRIICIEPKEMQFAQQGLMHTLYEFIRATYETRKNISFDDTHESQDLCYSRKIATIDLKDSSDCISLQLARIIFPKWFFRLVTRYRSYNLSWKGRIVRSHCLATMGNALCFPLQTLIFWAFAQATMRRYRIDTMDRQHELRVYGDDIIVPRLISHRLCEVLGDVGLVVNVDKTCHHTLVKESCGEWVHNGNKVQLLYLREPYVENHRVWTAYVAYYREARRLGLIALASSILTLCERIVPSPPTRWSRTLHRLEYRVPSLVMKGHREEFSNEAGLYAYFVGNDTTPFLYGTVKVKQRWVADHPYG